MIEGKLWGQTAVIARNPFMSVHRAEIDAGKCCSRHFHRHKWNGFFVERGVVAIRVEHGDLETVTVLKAGDSTEVAPGVVHRFECSEPAVLFEFYWPAALEADDIARHDEGGDLAELP